jgi:hypothetical protein
MIPSHISTVATPLAEIARTGECHEMHRDCCESDSCVMSALLASSPPRFLSRLRCSATSIPVHDVQNIAVHKGCGILTPHKVQVIECLQGHSELANDIGQGAPDLIDVL